MKRGRHAAADGSFGRSAGSAALRGALLIVAAIVLGVVLLRATDSPEPFADISDQEARPTTTTTVEDDGTTTTTAAAPRDPSEVTVLVANASGVQGAAGRVQEQLAAANYNVLAAVNASGTTEASVVYYAEGFEAEAAALAASLGEPAPAVQPMPEAPPVDDLRGAAVLVVLAADLASG